MISIQLIKPNKLAGNILVKQSAIINCAYNPDIVAFLKSLPTRAYNVEEKNWEIPINSVSDFCNRFTEHEIEITGNIIEEIKEKLAQIPSNYIFKTKPFNHQEQGVKFALTKDKFLLCDDQGLGKTHQIINWSCILKQQNKIKRVLIICGVNSLKYNWQKEVEAHSNEKAWVLGTRHRKNGRAYEGSAKDKLDDLDRLPNCTFLMTNIETMRAGSKKVGNKYVFPVVEKLQKLIEKGEISVLALDESHKCFEYNTEVVTNYGLLKIGEIVDKKIPCNVLSYNEKDDIYQYKPITSYFRNDTSKSKFIELRFNVNGKLRIIRCTDDHKIYTKNRGWVTAKNLHETDIFDTCNFI